MKFIEHFDEGEHAHYCQDFGRSGVSRPRFVAIPTNEEETINTIKFARNEGLTVAVRGHAHSTGGQPLAEGGIIVDLKSGFKKVEEPKIDVENNVAYVDIQPGASWREVFAKCLREGLTPPTYSDYIELSVGGTVSSGGVGQSSFLHGLQLDNVLELDVVTGTGDL